MKPICVPCQRFYRAKKNGYFFIEAMPEENDALPGTQEPQKWTPYKIWVGDLYECGGCHAQIISGVCPHPISEHYLPDFAELVAKFNAAQFQVNDC